MALLDLPRELLENVLSYLDPTELSRFSTLNHSAHSFASSDNQILWRHAFLHAFDDPDDAWRLHPGCDMRSDSSEWNWYAETRRRFEALAIVLHSSWNAPQAGTIDHIDTILSMLDTAKSAPSDWEIARGIRPQVDDRSSLNIQQLGYFNEYRPGLESMIHDERKDDRGLLSLWEHRPPGRPMTRSMTITQTGRPLSAARLHVLYGITARERLDHKAKGSARRIVYDWSRTQEETDHGPYRKSGEVDWLYLEALCSVMGRNFETCVDGRIAMPQGFCYSIPHRCLQDPTTPEDWARVRGPWIGTYAFLDYADLFAFNAWEGHGVRPALDDEPEACGDLMRLEMQLDQDVKNDFRLRTNIPHDPSLPPLYFSGHSREHGGFRRPLVGVRGRACLILGGREVRWTYIISYGGADQWRLEGIQPGGVRSGGVFGIWSQCDHEPNGPVGPFCYFPLELCKPTAVVLSRSQDVDPGDDSGHIEINLVA